MVYAHIAVLTKNLEQSIKWYEKVFQFKAKQIVDKGTMRYIFLYHENYPSIEIELIEKDVEGEITYGPIDHFALVIENIDEFIKKFPSTEIKYQSTEPIITATGLKTIFIFGPNNEKIQLIEKAN